MVDFPDPELPMIATNSPLATVRDTPRRASTEPPLSGKLVTRSRAARIAVMPFESSRGPSGHVSLARTRARGVGRDLAQEETQHGAEDRFEQPAVGRCSGLNAIADQYLGHCDGEGAPVTRTVLMVRPANRPQAGGRRARCRNGGHVQLVGWRWSSGCHRRR